MELNPADVKLNVLVLRESEDFTSSETPRREAFKRLVVSLQQSQLVNMLMEFEEPYYIVELAHLMNYMSGGYSDPSNMNTIFLDPLPSPSTHGRVPNRLEEITKFIFDVRALFPGVVFVFYIDFNELE